MNEYNTKLNLLLSNISTTGVTRKYWMRCYCIDQWHAIVHG